MKSILKRVPIPMAGLALGLAALGNLLQNVSESMRMFCGLLSFCIWLLVLIKIALFPQQVRRDLNSPIIASVSATLFMTGMQLAVYAKSVIGPAAMILWLAAVAGHLLFIFWFSRKFMRRFSLRNVYPTFFIAYVGIVVAAVTAPQFGMERLGTLLFWYGCAAYLVMFILITLRYIKHPIPLAARPLFCIYSAPMSLCLSGYLMSADHHSPMLLLFMGATAQVLFFAVLCRLPRLLRLPFYPSYAAFTFPFVITAFGLRELLSWFAAAGYAVPQAAYLLLAFEMLLATALVFYTLVRYLRHLACGLQDDPALLFDECRWCCT